MFQALPPPLSYAIPFVIVLGVLVFFHELGHYLAARWMGVHVEAFSIGFGKVIARWRDRVGTEWRISVLPLGGYVKLHGQERPEEASADVRAAWVAGKTFHEKEVWRRAIVIAAGPVANFVLAAFLYGCLFATQGQPIANPAAVVGDVEPGTPAARAGVLPGDTIVRVGDAPVATFHDLQALVLPHPDAPLQVTIRRQGADHVVSLVTASRRENGHRVGALGVTNAVSYRKLDLGEAALRGVAQTYEVSRQTLAGVWQIIAHDRGADELGGPLRIAQLSGQVAALGFASLVSFVALLSVNLGLINLFPIPVLDGGHLMFYLFEAVRGRPLPPRAIEYGFRAGLALLAALFVFATWNDLTHLGVVRWVAALVG